MNKEHLTVILSLVLLFQSCSPKEPDEKIDKNAVASEQQQSSHTAVEISKKASPISISAKDSALSNAKHRFSAAFSGLKEDDPRYYEMFRKIWNESMEVLCARPLKVLSNSSDSSKYLPSEVSEVGKSSALPGKLRDQQVAFLANSREYEAFYTLLMLGSVSNCRELPSLFSQRADKLPATAGDIAAYLAISLALQNDTPELASLNSLDIWKALKQSRNPIYRLISIKGGLQVPTDNGDGEVSADLSASKADFFYSFHDESDPLILNAAIDALEALGDSNATHALKMIEEDQRLRSSKATRTYAETARQRVEHLIDLRIKHEKDHKKK